jgi:hypothetical protein
MSNIINLNDERELRQSHRHHQVMQGILDREECLALDPNTSEKDRKHHEALAAWIRSMPGMREQS